MLIDESFADDMLRVKNFIPAISVKGFEGDTDFRRVRGTFAAVERAGRGVGVRGAPAPWEGLSRRSVSRRACLERSAARARLRPRPGSGPATPRVRYVFAASEREAEPVASAPCGRIGRIGSARISPKEPA